ncbi:hypothetical protein SteCoe_39872 [Stentor coeruleus]|uniref:Uncharacterized protein n=1 Tax=Stentor coeruleus TaxID=5963 RepID=A0A1R2AKH7_9CILI|nr:hypothetical protein SteCoe_39872 [Stentor coeruleus]
MSIPVEIECTVYFKLFPNVDIEGKTNLTLTDGTGLFSDLYIDTYGIYKAIFNGACVDLIEAKDSIVIIGVDLIKISIGSIYVKKDKEVNITVNYFSPSNSIVNITTFVTLLSSNISMIGTTSLYGSFSKAVFNIKFDTLGKTTLSGFTDIDLKTIVSKFLEIKSWNQCA